MTISGGGDEMAEAKLVADQMMKRPPGWLQAILEALWEVIKIEIDTWFGRLRR